VKLLILVVVVIALLGLGRSHLSQAPTKPSHQRVQTSEPPMPDVHDLYATR
jgi:hypothetical protein